MNEYVSSSDRQNRIAEYLNRQGRISVAEIVDHFKVSEATARRDLEALSDQGKVERVHGGALAVKNAPPEPPILQREQEHFFEKHRIAAKAAELIHDGDTIFLGSGTTVLEVARVLRSRHQLTVITNSLPVMNLLTGLPEITLVSLGGMLRQSELSFIGHITMQSLTELRADKVFIGIHAVSIEEGLTNDYLPETMTDRATLKIARDVVLLADHSKVNAVATAFLAPIESIQTFVTDSETPTEFLDALRERGIKVLIG